MKMTAQFNENLNNVVLTSDDFELSSEFSPFTLKLRTNRFESPIEEKRFIRTVESLVRRCPEYKLWRSYITDVLGDTNCAITDESNQELTVEIHHHVPTLFTLVKAFVVRSITKNEEFCSFDIAKDVIEYHFKNKIGYVSIIKSLHEKHHNGFLNIPMSAVKGNYEAFLQEFSDYLDDEDLQSIYAKLRVTQSNCHWNKNSYSLNQDVSN